ncbi:MAG: NAD(P)H-quinone oxidoreductase [Burkholderiaceae bacterium]
MRQVAITRPGGPDVLVLERAEIPQPAANEVLIRVVAAGVNRPDVLQRMGLYDPPAGASLIPGLEVAGEIVECGPGCKRYRPGDLVCALVSGGGYAEYCLAPESQTLPIPKGLTFTQAAGIPETHFTVWSNVFDRGELQAGQSVLIHGGSSGIGTTAIQLAHQFGARVFATAGSIEKCQACLGLGTDKAINYKTEDFLSIVKEETQGRGVDLVLDMVGGKNIQKNIRSLAPDGRLVHIAFLESSVAEIDLMPVMLKRLTITGSTLRPRTLDQKAEIASKLQTHVWPLFESTKIRVVVDSCFSLEQVAQAHMLMESSTHIGKIILRLSDEADRVC